MNKLKAILLTAVAVLAVSCGSNGAQQSNEQQDENQIVGYKLTKGDMECMVLNWGARLQSLKFKDQDMVLGFDMDSLENYRAVKQNFGAVVGRYIGRILRATYVLDGDTAHLMQQNGGDCGHGGNPNYAGRMWRMQEKSSDSVKLRYVSPDGENGFPGELTVDVTYQLTDSALEISYSATTNKPTVLNLSNHSFFNLTGDLSMDVMMERLWIASDSLAEYNDRKQVTGRLIPVKDTPFDFNTLRAIGDSIDVDNEQLNVTGGYDHCYQLRNEDGGAIAMLVDLQTRVRMSVYTTEPAMQIYTANGHKGNIIGKDGKPNPRRNAICFETMHFPDSPNKPQWPSTVLRPGEEFKSKTVFAFETLQ